MGQLDILNVGAGHLKLTVDEGDAIEVEKMKRVVTDMLHRGFAIFVETDAGPVRVEAFDPENLTYIIDDAMATMAAEPASAALPEAPPPERGRGRQKREVKATDAKATAVGRSAGG